MKRIKYTVIVLFLIGMICSISTIQASAKNNSKLLVGDIDSSEWFIGVSSNQEEKNVCTVNEKIQLQIWGNKESITALTYQWESANERVATIDENGLVTCLELSEYGTEILCTIYDGEEIVTTLNCLVYISDPTMLFTSLTVKPGEYIPNCLAGLSMYSVVSFTSNNIKVVNVTEQNILVPYNFGVAKVKIVVDGKELLLTIAVADPTINTNWFLASAGKTKQLKVTGKSGATSVIYNSSNSNIASVSKEGKIQAKKIGNAVITVTVDNTKITCLVNVTYKKALNVINRAKKVLGKKYSQAKRMQKNYYDCSSLVWRMYKTQGIYFGSGNWAPTAAMEAKNMVKKKKAISYKYAKESKLLPGDIIFIARGKNGRYRNICHTAIYIGNGMIIHASGKEVSYGYYDYYRSKISVIARPLKK